MKKIKVDKHAMSYRVLTQYRYKSNSQYVVWFLGGFFLFVGVLFFFFFLKS